MVGANAAAWQAAGTAVVDSDRPAAGRTAGCLAPLSPLDDAGYTLAALSAWGRLELRVVAALPLLASVYE